MGGPGRSRMRRKDSCENSSHLHRRSVAPRDPQCQLTRFGHAAKRSAPTRQRACEGHCTPYKQTHPRGSARAREPRHVRYTTYKQTHTQNTLPVVDIRRRLNLRLVSSKHVTHKATLTKNKSVLMITCPTRARRAAETARARAPTPSERAARPERNVGREEKRERDAEDQCAHAANIPEPRTHRAAPRVTKSNQIKSNQIESN